MKKAKKGSLRKIFIFNGLLLLACFVLLEWVIQTKAEFSPVLEGEFKKLKIISAKPNVPDYHFNQLGFVKDVTRTFSDYKGSWLVINWWATWCAPCIKELPSLEQLQERFGPKGLRVVAIALDHDISEEKLTTFLQKHKLGGVVPQYYDGKHVISSALVLRGYPTTWIIDPYGRHVATYEGDVDWISNEALTLFESLLQ